MVIDRKKRVTDRDGLDFSRKFVVNENKCVSRSSVKNYDRIQRRLTPTVFDSIVRLID